MYIVGFNGPPHCGKDTLSKLLVEYMDSRITVPVIESSLSMPLRRLAYEMVGCEGNHLDGPDYDEFKKTVFRGFKREGSRYPEGCTGRELMIDVSERFLKPTYGQSIMPELLLNHYMNFRGLMTIRDCGFQCEIDPIINVVGAKNFYLVNVVRPGTSFEGDSREWVNHPNSTCRIQVYNDGSLEDFRIEASRIYDRLVNQMGWTL
jgi:hypothetical protein